MSARGGPRRRSRRLPRRFRWRTIGILVFVAALGLFLYVTRGRAPIHLPTTPDIDAGVTGADEIREHERRQLEAILRQHGRDGNDADHER